MGSLVVSLSATRSVDEVVTVRDPDVDAKAQSRKIQNRKNQRARRQLFVRAESVSRLTGVGLKIKDTQEASSQTSRPYTVKRWRLDEANELPARLASSKTGSTCTTFFVRQVPQPHVSTSLLASGSAADLQTRHPVHSYSDRSSVTPPPIIFPLSTDHLLQLVHYNVFRAFVTNKRTLNVLLTGWTEKPFSPTTCPIGGPYRDDTMIYPLNPNIPLCLRPTRLQQSRLHSLWINLIPFPHIRDNLIRREGKFDHWELLQDLIGSLINFTPSKGQRRALYSFEVTNPRPKSPSFAAKRDEDEVTAGRTSLLVWGEPYDMYNWEATPAFLEKWAWAVEGCYELFESSNRWRAMRGEEPMRFSEMDPDS